MVRAAEKTVLGEAAVRALETLVLGVAVEGGSTVGGVGVTAEASAALEEEHKAAAEQAAAVKVVVVMEVDSIAP